MPLTKIKSLGITDGTILGDDINSTFNLTGKTVTLPAGTGGKVLQVVHATSTTNSTITSSSFVTLGFSASITPSSTSNKIFIIVNFIVEATATSSFNIDRNGTLMSSETNGLGAIQTTNVNVMIGLNYLDSPSSTSSRTYTLFGRTSGTLYFDPGSATASMVLMEIAG